MEQIRAFIAIELPDPVKAGLSSLQNRLRPDEHPYVKWVHPDGVHLTLKFLGNIAEDGVPQIVQAITSAAEGASPFRLELGGLGAFPNFQRPQVIWAAIKGEVEKLATLQRGIDQALLALGFSMESRSFTPHLTLGRLRERASPGERRRLGELMVSTKFEGEIPFDVAEISLMRSRLTPKGAIYSRISSIQLESGLPTSHL
ncbi:MAG: RNA 2',3'-cyclic phosphodiesterase [Dehalococcoidia bacterium]